MAGQGDTQSSPQKQMAFTETNKGEYEMKRGQWACVEPGLVDMVEMRKAREVMNKTIARATSER
jgi:hypothetical protein